MSLYKLFKSLFPYFWSKDWKIRFLIIASIIFALLAVLFNLCIPIVLRSVLNFLNKANNSPEVFVILVVASYGIIWIAAQISLTLRSIFLFRPMHRVDRLMVLDFFKHVLSLPLKYHLDRKTGSLLSSVEQARNGMNNLINAVLWQIIPLSLEAIFAVIIISYMYGIVYAAIIFVTLSLYLLSTFYTANKSTYYQNLSNETYAATADYLNDAIINYETIKYFDTDNVELAECVDVLNKNENALTQTEYRMYLIGMLNMIIVGISITIITCYAGIAIAKHQLTIGDFVLLTGYLLQFSVPMSYFGYVVQVVKRAISQLNNFFEVLKAEPEINEASGISINLSSTKINFENIKFSYDTHREILKGISFEIPEGKMVAIVGPTGSGKSTIARLLFRFYDVTSGGILINNQNINSVDVASLRSVIGVVPQDTILFNNTLKYNIAYGNKNATEGEILEAIELAGLKDFVDKIPHGLETLVGERGLKLSGGEKQRVSIARMLLKKPRIYIFDEATSSLDVETEKKIQQNIETISKNTTTLVIAHRLSTVMHADQIIVLHHGEIIEKGNHEDLLMKNGFYAKMWKAQERKRV